MGANLVAQVLARWTHVSDRAFRVLVRMALTALDKPKDDAPAATYFAGRELLAMTLRTEGGTDQSRYRAVAKVIAELITARAIERTDGGRTGHNAVYRLTLGSAESADETPGQGGQLSHPQGGQISHPKGGQFRPIRVVNSATPRNQEEPLEELSEEIRGDLQTASRPSRATPPDANPTPVIALFPDSANAPDEKPYRPVPTFGRPWSSRSTDAIAEATARRAQRRAEHQASQAVEEIS